MLVLKNGVSKIIHGKHSLLLSVCIDSIVYFRPIRIVPPMPPAPVEASHALGIFEDHYLSIKAVGVLKNPINQSSKGVGVCCPETLPLAVHLDEYRVVGIDDTCRPSPRMSTIGSAELHPVFRKQV